MERELRLHVPQSARAAIGRALRAQKARRILLQARYFDTPGRELAQAGIALRLRREGRRWVQTVKAPGPDPLTRVEINHLRHTAELDLSLYDGTPLARTFARLAQPLALRYETRVTRLVLPVRSANAEVELAYDQGTTIARDLELPISELELEYISGDVRDLFEMAGVWLRDHALVVEARSKSERGDTLAKAAIANPPWPRQQGNAHAAQTLFTSRRAQPVQLPPDGSITQAYVASSAECLGQIIRNAALVAGVDSEGADDHTHAEYIHQLRVGIRRLRSCWKFFADWVRPVDAQVSDTLRAYFSLFGDARDDDVIRLVVEPTLILAGMPASQPLIQDSAYTAADRARTAAAARNPELQLALLALLEHLLLCGEAPAQADGQTGLPDTTQLAASSAASAAGPTAEPAAVLPVREPLPEAAARKRSGGKPERLDHLLAARLDAWTRKIAKGGKSFRHLPIETQHDLRKKVKMLRYSMDFSDSVLPRRRMRELRDTLQQVQDVLGDLNDFYVAQAHYTQQTANRPEAWFAIGWLRAMQEQRKAEAQRIFRRLRSQHLQG